MALRVDRLQALRERKKLSQRELARLSEIGSTMIRKYEAGLSDPGSEALKKIAEVLEVSTDYLVGLTDEVRGHMGDGTLSDEETNIVEVFRREGWSGLIRFSAEKLPR